MNFPLDFAISKGANFRRGDFLFWNPIEVPGQRVPAGAVHAQRVKKILAALFLQGRSGNSVQDHA